MILSPENSKFLITSEGDSEDDIYDYFKSLTDRKKTICWALIHTKEEWAGNWMIGREPHFLVTVNEEMFYPQTKKRKEALYFIWCCGNDDHYLEMRMLSKEKALEIFNLITVDDITKEELKAIGFTTG